jgi:hypothetical protein
MVMDVVQDGNLLITAVMQVPLSLTPRLAT